nr:MFS transporter [Clostridia bacterium]
MKLNVKQTFLVGLAFMSICAFWNLYDNMVPLILDQTYGLGETWTGAVMAMDNIAALFLLPFFGALSDRKGRRIPFILWGSMAAAGLSVVLTLVVRKGAAAPVMGQGLGGFLAVLALLLIAMGTYRSPAVALMPDVTPKHLRSKGNAIINLMGAIGGALMLVLPKFLVQRITTGSGTEAGDYTWLFVTVAGIMIASAWVVKLVIPEKRLKAEADAINEAREADQAPAQSTADSGSPARKLGKDELRSLVFILMSVFLWYMAYNAITTAFSRYALKVWNIDEGDASFCLLVATAAAIVSYWPVGIVSSKIGRKKVILAGVALMVIGFAGGFLLPGLSALAFAAFGLVGIGWAAINVNSYPMVVEMATGSDVGKYTGYYYTFSMAAQVLTPVLSGALLEYVGYWTLFPYALVMACAAFGTMLMVHHGDSKPEAKKGLEALDVED